MAIVKTLDVFCDGCPAWTHGDTGQRVSTSAARQTARREGWKFVRGKDLCPDCLKEKDGGD